MSPFTGTTLLLLVLSTVAPVPQPQPPSKAGAATAKTAEKTYVRARHGDHAIAQLYAEGFNALPARQKRLAWHLTMAAHAGEPIRYDQLGWNNVRIKQVLENVYLFGLDAPVDPKAGTFERQLLDYLIRFYGYAGNHESATSLKFVPAFSFEQLERFALKAYAAGADFGVKDEAALKTLLRELRPSLFDAAFEPTLTAKTPPPGQDRLTASANTLYGKDVTEKDLQGFEPQHPLNSRLVKVDGKLVEQVFRAGTPDRKVAPGLYAPPLTRVISHLTEARRYADPRQAAALSKLIRYLQTGNPKDWDAYNIAWLRSDPRVDANIGFIETYVDARGQKGEWEVLVNYRDEADMRLMRVLGERAQYFEDRMPWPDAYKRKNIRAPVAKAIRLVEASPQPPAGINLPNEEHVREKYGSKSVLVMNTIEAAQAIERTPLDVAFSLTPEEKEAARTLGPAARKLMVAFHEVTGHGSGRQDPKLQGSPADHLKEYDNTLEETRADLIALWLVFDPMVAKMGFDNPRQLGEQMYRSFLIEALTNLRLVSTGTAFEEDHQRGNWLTLNWLLEKGVVELVRKETCPEGRPVEGTSCPQHTFVRVKDYDQMREAVGELLSKLMVIKATGDYAAIKKLVDEKGVRFDPKLRDEIAARVAAQDIPPSIFFSSPLLVPTVAANGRIRGVEAVHTQPFLERHLLKSLLADLSPREAAKLAATVGTDRTRLLEALRSQRSRRLAPAPAQP